MSILSKWFQQYDPVLSDLSIGIVDSSDMWCEHVSAGFAVLHLLQSLHFLRRIVFNGLPQGSIQLVCLIISVVVGYTAQLHAFYSRYNNCEDHWTAAYNCLTMDMRNCLTIDMRNCLTMDMHNTWKINHLRSIAWMASENERQPSTFLNYREPLSNL